MQPHPLPTQRKSNSGGDNKFVEIAIPARTHSLVKKHTSLLFSSLINLLKEHSAETTTWNRFASHLSAPHFPLLSRHRQWGLVDGWRRRSRRRWTTQVNAIRNWIVAVLLFVAGFMFSIEAQLCRSSSSPPPPLGCFYRIQGRKRDSRTLAIYIE